MRALLLYLASPYTHKDAKVRQYRFEAACRATAALIKCDWLAFSPIAHTVPVAEFGEYSTETEWVDWAKYDINFLRRCTYFAILKLDGWKESVGVQAELKEAKRTSKVLFSVNPVTFEVTPGI